ncbi:uncharacterized protein VTP21DRAFT_9517 [Calcarisporiella thermophila]|uniref:uncharacterized protein n=1 Tax=Calcarisporiella thermophila TaxID=911321 RepID=UPI00374330A5
MPAGISRKRSSPLSLSDKSPMSWKRFHHVAAESLAKPPKFRKLDESDSESGDDGMCDEPNRLLRIPKSRSHARSPRIRPQHPHIPSKLNGATNCAVCYRQRLFTATFTRCDKCSAEVCMVCVRGCDACRGAVCSRCCVEIPENDDVLVLCHGCKLAQS